MLSNPADSDCSVLLHVHPHDHDQDSESLQGEQNASSPDETTVERRVGRLNPLVVLHFRDSFNRPITVCLWFRMGSLLGAFLVSTIFLVVYCLTIYPTVPGGDSGELIVAACTLGVPHPPGYPLHTIMGHLSFALLPGSPAARVNFVSALCSAVACGICFTTINMISRATLVKLRCKTNCSEATAEECMLGSFFGSGMYGFSPLVWTYSVQAEVFALNNLFTALLTWQTCQILVHDPQQAKQDSKKGATAAETIHSAMTPFWGAATLGLGLTNQHTLVLAGAPMALAVLRGDGSWRLMTVGSLITLAGCFLVALLPYLYLVAAGRRPAEGAWGDTGTLSGLWVHVTRQEYGSLKLYPGREGPRQGVECLRVGAGLYLQSLWRQFGAVGTAASILGAMSTLSVAGGPRRAASAIGSAWVFYVLVFHSLANLPVEDGQHRDLFREVLSRFWLLPNTLLAVAVGVGASVTAHFISTLDTWHYTAREQFENRWRHKLLRSLVAIAVVGTVTHQAAVNWRECDMSSEWGVWEAGQRVLHSVPYRGVLLVKGDLATNAVRYLRLCERARSDVAQLDLSHASYRWFGKQHALGHHSDLILPGPRLSRLRGLNDTYRLSALLEANVQEKSIWSRKVNSKGERDDVEHRPVVLSPGLAAQYGEEELAVVEMWPSGVLLRAFTVGSGPGQASEGLRAWARDCAVRVPGVGPARGEAGAGWEGRWERVAEQEAATALPNVVLQMLSVAKTVPPAAHGGRGGEAGVFGEAAAMNDEATRDEGGGQQYWWSRAGCELVVRAGAGPGVRKERSAQGLTLCEDRWQDGEEARRREYCRLDSLQGCRAVLRGGTDLRREEWLTCAAHILVCLVEHGDTQRLNSSEAVLWKNLGVALDQLLVLHPRDASLQASRVHALQKYAKMVTCHGGNAAGDRDDVLELLAMEGASVTC